MLPPCSSSLVSSSHSYDEIITNIQPRNDALALLSPPSVVLQEGGRGNAVAKARCLSLVHVSGIQIIQRNIDPCQWCDVQQFSSQARSQSSAVYHGSYTAVPSVLCLVVLSFFFSFLLLSFVWGTYSVLDAGLSFGRRGLVYIWLGYWIVHTDLLKGLLQALPLSLHSLIIKELSHPSCGRRHGQVLAC